jgi:hypothetical protein
MTITPEYGEEERMKQQAEALRPRHQGVAEDEIHEHEREEAELDYLEPEDNEAHAPGQVCERCGAVITAGQDARRRPDGHWVHEVCPPDLARLSAEDTPPDDRG